MLSVKIICVGKLKERFYSDAVDEYMKRLSAYCRPEIAEIAETRLPDRPSEGEIASALSKEAAAISQCIPKGSAVIAMCIEGKQMSSEEVAGMLSGFALGGVPKLCFLIGGSCGLDEELKRSADVRMSMSRMTFPHHLARVMLLEQLYRGFNICGGGKYHK